MSGSNSLSVVGLYVPLLFVKIHPLLTGAERLTMNCIFGFKQRKCSQTSNSSKLNCSNRKALKQRLFEDKELLKIMISKHFLKLLTQSVKEKHIYIFKCDTKNSIKALNTETIRYESDFFFLLLKTFVTTNFER